MSLLSEAQARAIRRDLSVLYVHTYTRTPRTLQAEGTNDDGSRDWEDGTPVTGVRCKYDPSSVLAVDVLSRTTINTPVLVVAHDDPSTVGTKVSNIRNEGDVILVMGPLEVETDTPSADFGPILERVLTLRGGQTRKT